MEQQKYTSVTVPYPDAPELQLRIAVGACKLKIRSGESDTWVTGAYRDASGQLPVRVQQEGGRVTIDHVRNVLNIVGFLSGIPTLELTVSKSRPFSLMIEAAASDNDVDFGGLPLTRLEMRQGAGRSELQFSAPNPEPMSLLQLTVGASAMTVRNLANANAAVMTLEGGAAGYTFDFGGTLQRDAFAKISSGVSSVEIIVPSATAAKITSEAVLSSVDLGDGFTKRERGFWTPAAVEGTTPVLRVETSVALGTLKLRLTETLKSEQPQLATGGVAPAL